MLLPAPVGATNRTSDPASAAATTSACPERSALRPKTSRATASAAALGAGCSGITCSPQPPTGGQRGDHVAHPGQPPTHTPAAVGAPVPEQAEQVQPGQEG